MNIIIKKSNNQNNKFTAVINNDKKIHFGDSKYQDFTKHKDPERKKSLFSTA